MKRILTIVIIILAGASAFAQTSQQTAYSGPSIRLHGYTTYAFDDNYVGASYTSTDYFEGKILGGFQYGGGLEVMPFPTAGVEFTYLRLDSKAPIEYYSNGVEFTSFDLAQNFFLLSFNKYVPVNPRIEPFAGLQIGMDVFNVENPDNGYSSGATKFAWGLKAGLHVWASEKVGLKLQAGLLSAVQAVGGGLYFGTGGAGAGVTGFSTYYQFSLGGGLVFKIK